MNSSGVLNVASSKVGDTPPGIPPENRDWFFQPFATAGKANGIGLGFARSREVVIEHGGKIWAEPRRGTCFVIHSAEAARALSVGSLCFETSTNTHGQDINETTWAEDNTLDTKGYEESYLVRRRSFGTGSAVFHADVLSWGHKE